LSTVDESEFPAPVWSHDEPRIAGATDVGVVRTVNQDAFGRFDDAERSEILLVVADGLGGHRGGEVASQMAVELLGRGVFEGQADPASRLRAAIQHANEEIYRASLDDTSLDGMGTTVVCLLLAEEGPSHVAHVGDSRLYRLRAGRIGSLTEDHSLVATLVREGVLSEEAARDDPRRNQILLALGVRPDTEIDVAPVELAPGDIYLLCSDGLHGMLDDATILTLARRPTRPDDVVQKLIAAANDAGGTDNVTVVLAQLPDPMPVDPLPVDKLRALATRWLDSTRALLSGAKEPERDSDRTDADAQRDDSER